MGFPTSSNAAQAAAQAPEFGPQMPLSEKLLAIAIRAQNFTGASGVAVAIKEGDEVVCRASWGTSAPDVGVPLRDQNSFTYQCLRAGTPMRCDDAATDPRVDADACAALGISSIAAAPVRNGDEVMGVIGAFSEGVNAFTETHMVVLTTLGEVVGKFLKDEPQTAPLPSEEPLALDVAPASADIEPFQELFAESATTAGLKSGETPTEPAAGQSGARVPSAPISALEKESEVRPEEMHVWADIPRDPGLVSPAEHIAPVTAPKVPKTPAGTKPLRTGIPKYSPPAVAAKPAKPEKPSARVPVALPSFAGDKPVADRGIDVHFFIAQAIALLQRRFVIPAAGGALVLIALVGWTFHNFHSRRAPALAPISQEQSAETSAPQTPEPAELTSSSPVVSNVVDVSSKPVAEKPSVGKREREKPKEKEPFVETDKPVRQPTAIPAVAPVPEPPPSVSVASASLPPQLLALKSAVPAGPRSAPLKMSSFSPSTLVHKVPPVFPEMAKKYHLQGKVVLQAKVGTDGLVSDVKVISGPGVFQQSAMNAVKQWRYKPALLDGQPVESTAEITLNFSAPR